MAARTGKEFLDRLSGSRPTVHIQGETLVGGIQDHPAFRNVVRSYAELYDLQHAPEHRDVLTHPSPTSGEPVGTAFLTPRTPQDLVKRREAFKVWADHSMGMLGRTGDYMNSSLMSLASAADWFAQSDPAFGENIRRYVEKVREEDLLCTHTLIPPQVNRAVAGTQQGGGKLAARIVKEDDNGVVIRGARMLATIAPFADEMLVFPSTVLRGTPEDKPYSYAFAVPNDAKGLRYIAREPLDYDRPRHDHPLGSRFDESDAVVVFDDVHVPYERCFVLGDAELCNGFYTRTSATAHMTHQVVTRTAAKTEYILGLVSLLTEAIAIEQFQHVQEDVAEVISTLETLRAFLRAAEADAEVNEYGVLTPAWVPLNTARNLYPKLYQRFPQILRKLGASGLMATPTEADVFGPAAGDIHSYLQSATLSGEERVKLFRLVWDTCVSAFSSRQALYEYYFFGDPVRMAGAYVNSYDREPYRAKVQAFLDRAS
ncbi:4-hydroxyphenylacetate 3-monooxygenase, oxygenase component [Nonomuraea lactucae]|uniref:4-hydroxyphenylacetate 3-monooxygenase, oxygenase component n=1 Tax=Nonomuraea lactucae TaxID=2249762 RepID=UPI000DE39F7C|nr:4-hydroxyphenylacetate 3-monooxygenase, oxygenase component [Nonomuraea lactucae]